MSAALGWAGVTLILGGGLMLVVVVVAVVTDGDLGQPPLRYFVLLINMLVGVFAGALLCVSATSAVFEVRNRRRRTDAVADELLAWARVLDRAVVAGAPGAEDARRTVVARDGS